MEIDVATISREQAGQLFPTLLTPRPVVLIGTLDPASGRRNLAPYSSVSWIANRPPMVCLSVGRRRDGSAKDTLRCAQESGALVVNMVTRAQTEVALRAAAHEGAGDSLADDYLRLDLSRSDFAGFAAGRVSDAPVSLGCTVVAAYEALPSEATVLLATVDRIHISDAWFAHTERAAKQNDIVASIAAEYYVGLGDTDEFFLARTWE